MGWTYTHKDPSVPPKEFFANRFNYQHEDGRYGKIIAFALKNLRTAYAAYEVWSPELGKEVVGLVILVNYAPSDYYNFGFKEMEESMGPFESECPEKILKLLTPTDSEYANNWRNRCWENIRKSKRKRTKGLRIRFEKPVTFTTAIKFRIYSAGCPKRDLC